MDGQTTLNSTDEPSSVLPRSPTAFLFGIILVICGTVLPRGFLTAGLPYPLGRKVFLLGLGEWSIKLALVVAGIICIDHGLSPEASRRFRTLWFGWCAILLGAGGGGALLVVVWAQYFRGLTNLLFATYKTALLLAGIYTMVGIGLSLIASYGSSALIAFAQKYRGLPAASFFAKPAETTHLCSMTTPFADPSPNRISVTSLEPHLAGSPLHQPTSPYPCFIMGVKWLLALCFGEIALLAIIGQISSFPESPMFIGFIAILFIMMGAPWVVGIWGGSRESNNRGVTPLHRDASELYFILSHSFGLAIGPILLLLFGIELLPRGGHSLILAWHALGELTVFYTIPIFSVSFYSSLYFFSNPISSDPEG